MDYTNVYDGFSGVELEYDWTMIGKYWVIFVGKPNQWWENQRKMGLVPENRWENIEK